MTNTETTSTAVKQAGNARNSGHIYHKCHSDDCFVCRGGLAECTICSGAEASMPTDCPGYRMTAEQMDAVQQGDLDFKDGKWLKQAAKHTPGPWVTDGGPHIQAIYTPTDGGKSFYRTIARTDQPLVSPEQQGANSCLIAASPVLLEMLRHFLARGEVAAATYRQMAKTENAKANNGLAEEQEWWNAQAREVIAKATHIPA